MSQQIQPGNIEVDSVGNSVQNGQVVSGLQLLIWQKKDESCRLSHHIAILTIMVLQWLLKSVRNYSS